MNDEPDRERVDSEFKEFCVALGVEPGEPLGPARFEFGKLNVKDRQLATRKAATYREWAKANPKKRKLAPEIWLHNREFELVREVEKSAAQAHGLAGPKLFVKRGTEAWDAWNAYRRATDARYRHYAVGSDCWPTARSAEHGGTGWWFPSLFPPHSDGASEAAE
jgi:hypothetical protein